MKRKKRIFRLVAATGAAVVLCLALLTGCVSQNGGTVFKSEYEINVWGSGAKEAVTSATDRFSVLEALLSPVIEGSDVFRINEAKANVPVSVSDDTIFLFEHCKTLYERSGKAFNPAIYPIVELWKFDPANYDKDHGDNMSVPSEAEINALLPFCDFDFFVLNKDEKTITKTVTEAKLDFGASAKGYAADAAGKFFFEHPDFLINVGGTVLIGSDSKTIGILKPYTEKDVAKVLTVAKQGIATSGSYLRNFVSDDVIYHHIIGADGYPAGIREENPKVSVTVIGGSAFVADMLSTAGMLLSEESFSEVLSYYNACAYIIYKDSTERLLNGFEKYIKE